MAIPKAQLSQTDAINLNQFFIWILLISIVASLVVYWFSKLVTHPLTEMANDLKLSAQKYSKKLTLPTHLQDEVGMLARAFEEKTNQVNQLAKFDGLTGLPNRESMLNHLDEPKKFEIKDIEADHIKPWHEGGKTIAENCQLLCKQCNRTKSGN